MRADRLLSLLMLLQTRGRMTAEDLSHELEVSVRTIYRDIEALSLAGVPVYTERGPGGGCALLDSYRTTLTGLTDAEVRALFALNIPAPLADLGLGNELKTALLKLSAALPASRRDEERHVRQRVHLDTTWWFQTREPMPGLATIQQAVWQDRKLILTQSLLFDAELEREVEPYGLVAKAGAWYLVWAGEGRMDATPLSEITSARLLADAFDRHPDFDLAAFWQQWAAAYESNQPCYPVTVRISRELVPYLSFLTSGIVAVAPDATQAGIDQETQIVNLVFDTFEGARRQILGLGRAVVVLSPRALRASVVDYAQQIAMLYQGLALE